MVTKAKSEQVAEQRIALMCLILEPVSVESIKQNKDGPGVRLQVQLPIFVHLSREG